MLFVLYKKIYHVHLIVYFKNEMCALVIDWDVKIKDTIIADLTFFLLERWSKGKQCQTTKPPLVIIRNHMHFA